jgi:riboflavin synthase
MFTGLIETIGTVAGIEKRGAAARLVIKSSLPAGEVSLGDSIAVNGICLTVVGMEAGTHAFDLSPESLDRTAFRKLGRGSRVNLERALRLSDRLGGHIVTGHVDCVAQVAERREASGNVILAFRIPRQHAPYLIEKGSVAIDGVSLTVNSVGPEDFTVNIIPHTATRTTLQEIRPGDEVNIETDIVGKYVGRLLATRKEGEGITLDLLAKNGFL